MKKLVICALALALLGCNGEEPAAEAEQPEEAAVEAEQPEEEVVEAEETPEMVETEEADDEPAASGEDWPQQVRDNFLDACLLESDGQEAYCVCVLEDLEESYTLAEFEEVERELETTGVVPADLEQIIDSCIAQHL